MGTFLSVYFGIGLICMFISIFMYWCSNGYTFKDRIASTLFAFFLGTPFVIYCIGMGVCEWWLTYRKCKKYKIGFYES